MKPKRVRKRVENVRGLGIVTRRQRTGGLAYMAWIWDSAQERKRYATFPTKAAAATWRRDQLRRMYGDQPKRHGKVDEAYTRLRKTLDECQGARSELSGPTLRRLDAIMADLYAAEDQFLDLLRGAT